MSTGALLQPLVSSEIILTFVHSSSVDKSFLAHFIICGHTVSHLFFYPVDFVRVTCTKFQCDITVRYSVRNRKNISRRVLALRHYLLNAQYFTILVFINRPDELTLTHLSKSCTFVGFACMGAYCRFSFGRLLGCCAYICGFN